MDIEKHCDLNVEPSRSHVAIATSVSGDKCDQRAVALATAGPSCGVVVCPADTTAAIRGLSSPVAVEKRLQGGHVALAITLHRKRLRSAGDGGCRDVL